MPVDFRSQFDIPRDVCYLNNAYMGPQPKRVLDAAVSGAVRRAEAWRIRAVDFFTHVERLREAYARQIACPPDNVAIVPSAGYGVACAAANLPTSSSGVILAMEDQFPSNYYAWRRRSLETGAEFRVVRPEPGQSWSDALLAALDEFGERIEVATLEGHHWSSAAIVDLERVVPALRSADAAVVLDLTQTIGATPVDVGRLKPDFMVASGYKWQFCPYGVAFLYVDDRHFDGVPIEEAWINRAGAEDFSRLSEFTDRYQPGARRFDVSEKSSFSNVAGALEALATLEEWGIASISAALTKTNARIADVLESQGFQTTQAIDRAPHFQGARLPDVDPRALAQRLSENRVFASVRGENLRIAPHLYTDDEDIVRFADVLGEALAAA